MLNSLTLIAIGALATWLYQWDRAQMSQTVNEAEGNTKMIIAERVVMFMGALLLAGTVVTVIRGVLAVIGIR